LVSPFFAARSSAADLIQLSSDFRARHILISRYACNYLGKIVLTNDCSIAIGLGALLLGFRQVRSVSEHHAAFFCAF